MQAGKQGGIKWELTVPYNLQQNGVVEIALFLINYMDFPMSSWVEACNTTVYIFNRCYNRILKDMTPEEAFTSLKPKKYLIFMCLVV